MIKEITALVDWQHLSFARPWAALLLLLVPLAIWLHSRWGKAPAMRLTSLNGLKGAPRGWRVTWRPLLIVLRSIALVMLVIALTGPRSTNVTELVDTDGIDIMLCLDVSGSMMAQDFQPNRMEAAKKVAADFIDSRPVDRIGLVIFSGESFTKCPVTIDHDMLKNQLASVKDGELTDGTAIGDGLATGVDRLRHTNGKSRVIILLTDGVNNVGKVGPELALEIAKAYKMRVYTIGIGSQGTRVQIQTPQGMQTMIADIDEPLLRKIAGQTGGVYYRATGNSSLVEIYKSIDKLEKTKVETSSYKRYAELFFPFAFLAILCLALELLLRYTIFRTIT